MSIYGKLIQQLTKRAGKLFVGPGATSIISPSRGKLYKDTMEHFYTTQKIKVGRDIKILKTARDNKLAVYTENPVYGDTVIATAESKLDTLNRGYSKFKANTGGGNTEKYLARELSKQTANLSDDASDAAMYRFNLLNPASKQIASSRVIPNPIAGSGPESITLGKGDPYMRWSKKMAGTEGGAYHPGTGEINLATRGTQGQKLVPTAKTIHGKAPGYVYEGTRRGGSAIHEMTHGVQGRLGVFPPKMTIAANMPVNVFQQTTSWNNPLWSNVKHIPSGKFTKTSETNILYRLFQQNTGKNPFTKKLSEKYLHEFMLIQPKRMAKADKILRKFGFQGSAKSNVSGGIYTEKLSFLDDFMFQPGGEKKFVKLQKAFQKEGLHFETWLSYTDDLAGYHGYTAAPHEISAKVNQFRDLLPIDQKLILSNKPGLSQAGAHYKKYYLEELKSIYGKDMSKGSPLRQIMSKMFGVAPVASIPAFGLSKDS